MHTVHSVVLSSGRPVPSENSNFQRGEGVCLVLSGRARTAFDAGGSQWFAVSSRLLHARLKFEHAGQECTWIHAVVCYAPTYRTARPQKDELYNQLQQCVLSITASHQVVILGDFNARVGKSMDKTDVWYGVRGLCGTGAVNESGVEFLNFLARNELAITNTWFPRKDIHLQTWHHSRSKIWHCIDFIIVRQQHMDSVMICHGIRSAECDTDHKLLCMTWRPSKPQSHPQKRKPAVNRFAVSNFFSSPASSPDDIQATSCMVAHYQAQLSSRLEKWQHDARLTLSGSL